MIYLATRWSGQLHFWRWDKKTSGDKKKQIKNLREEISVKVSNLEARKNLTGGDKMELNEFGGENVERIVLTVTNGGILWRGLSISTLLLSTYFDLIELFIHSTNMCTFDTNKYSLISLLHVSASHHPHAALHQHLKPNKV